MGPNFEYDYCCNGIGNTEAEAFENCLENMASFDSFDSFDFTEADEKLIRDDCGRVDDNVTAADELGVDEDDEESTFNDFPAYWHVGIKWNAQEEKRYKRIQDIQDIQNIQPLRYEDYSPINSIDKHGVFGTWGYKHRADGSASYGDFKDTDWPDSVGDYFNMLCDDIEETDELYFYVPYATGSDYSGSTVEVSNAQYMEDTYNEHDWVHPVYGGHGTYAVAIGVTGLLDCDKDTFDEVCELLESLVNYPLIDEQAHSEYEMEAIENAWNICVKDDFIRA